MQDKSCNCWFTRANGAKKRFLAGGSESRSDCRWVYGLPGRRRVAVEVTFKIRSATACHLSTSTPIEKAKSRACDPARCSRRGSVVAVVGWISPDNSGAQPALSGHGRFRQQPSFRGPYVCKYAGVYPPIPGHHLTEPFVVKLLQPADDCDLNQVVEHESFSLVT